MNQRSRITGVLSTAGLLVALTVAAASAAVLVNPVTSARIVESTAQFYGGTTAADLLPN